VAAASESTSGPGRRLGADRSSRFTRLVNAVGVAHRTIRRFAHEGGLIDVSVTIPV